MRRRLRDAMARAQGASVGRSRAWPGRAPRGGGSCTATCWRSSVASAAKPTREGQPFSERAAPPPRVGSRGGAPRALPEWRAPRCRGRARRTPWSGARRSANRPAPAGARRAERDRQREDDQGKIEAGLGKPAERQMRLSRAQQRRRLDEQRLEPLVDADREQRDQQSAGERRRRYAEEQAALGIRVECAQEPAIAAQPAAGEQAAEGRDQDRRGHQHAPRAADGERVQHLQVAAPAARAASRAGRRAGSRPSTPTKKNPSTAARSTARAPGRRRVEHWKGRREARCASTTARRRARPCTRGGVNTRVRASRPS